MTRCDLHPIEIARAHCHKDYVEPLLDRVRDATTGFEQDHALRALREIAEHLSPYERPPLLRKLPVDEVIREMSGEAGLLLLEQLRAQLGRTDA